MQRMLSEITEADVIWETSANNLKLVHVNSLGNWKTMKYYSESISLISIYHYCNTMNERSCLRNKLSAQYSTDKSIRMEAISCE